MKNLSKFIILVLISHSLSATKANAQQLIPDENISIAKNLVLEVSTVTSKNYKEVTNALTAINGVTIVAYCEEARIFLINYNQVLIPKPEPIADAIKQLHPSYKSKVMYNLKFDDVIKNCKLTMLPLLMEVQ